MSALLSKWRALDAGPAASRLLMHATCRAKWLKNSEGMRSALRSRGEFQKKLRSKLRLYKMPRSPTNEKTNHFLDWYIACIPAGAFR
jgi:hypothetical protein